MLHFRLVSSPEARACVQNTLKAKAKVIPADYFVGTI